MMMNQIPPSTPQQQQQASTLEFVFVSHLLTSTDFSLSLSVHV